MLKERGIIFLIRAIQIKYYTSGLNRLQIRYILIKLECVRKTYGSLVKGVVLILELKM